MAIGSARWEDGPKSMRIAIISDIHANLEALESLPRDWDELWVLGDLVNYGPSPSEAVEFVRRNAAVVIRGNHDDAIGAGRDPRCSGPFREMARAMQAYTEATLDEEQKAYLRALPLTVQKEIAGRRFFLCHAAPSDPLYQYLPPDSARWPAEVSATPADIILTGHTHLPFHRREGDRQILNPGSVGQPKHGRPEACYAVWENGTLSLRTNAYDFEATIRRLNALPVDPRIRLSLAHVLRNGGLRTEQP